MTVRDGATYSTNGISIHTALAGCDSDEAMVMDLLKISIHTALAGCDPYGFPKRMR